MGGKERKMTTLKVSPHGSFTVTQIAHNIAICEATNGDQHGWGNATSTEPAFIAYLGCSKDEAKQQIKKIANLYESCEIRKSKYLTDFECEIKIKGMKRQDINLLIE